LTSINATAKPLAGAMLFSDNLVFYRKKEVLLFLILTIFKKINGLIYEKKITTVHTCITFYAPAGR
jgi:hypothetical protein